MSVQHFLNAGQLVKAVSCTQKHKTHVTLTFDLLHWYSMGFRGCQDTFWYSRAISSS